MNFYLTYFDTNSNSVIVYDNRQTHIYAYAFKSSPSICNQMYTVSEIVKSLDFFDKYKYYVKFNISHYSELISNKQISMHFYDFGRSNQIVITINRNQFEVSSGI